jgi:hypothetical protein
MLLRSATSFGLAFLAFLAVFSILHTHPCAQEIAYNTECTYRVSANHKDRLLAVDPPPHTHTY